MKEENGINNTPPTPPFSIPRVLSTSHHQLLQSSSSTNPDTLLSPTFLPALPTTRFLLLLLRRRRRRIKSRQHTASARDVLLVAIPRRASPHQRWCGMFNIIVRELSFALALSFSFPSLSLA